MSIWRTEDPMVGAVIEGGHVLLDKIRELSRKNPAQQRSK